MVILVAFCLLYIDVLCYAINQGYVAFLFYDWSYQINKKLSH